MELDVISHSFHATNNFFDGIVEKCQQYGPKIMIELSRIIALPTVGVDQQVALYCLSVSIETLTANQNGYLHILSTE